MANPTRRVWDSSVVIDYLEGKPRAYPHVPLIIEEAKRGETEILVSSFAEIEVCKIRGVPLTDDQEEMIKEFFGRHYVIRCMVDYRVAEVARRIARITSQSPDMATVKPKDAVHVATAVRWGVSLFEVFDGPLHKVVNDHPELIPGIRVREPLYEGQARAEDLLREADPMNQQGERRA